MNQRNLNYALCVSLLFVWHTVSAQEEKNAHSQYGQDVFVNEHFFKNKKNGIFVDIGASDGVLLSNTYFFEKSLEWAGICIEPRPDKFAELCKNRSCICVNGCIADQAGEQPFLFLEGYTGDLSGLVATYNQHHINRINNELIARGGSHQLIKMPCYLLMDILKRCAINHIDYLSIDTEGSELSILRSINFNEVTIDIIDVENNYGDTEIAAFLIEQGYDLVAKIDCDEIYRRKNYD